MDIPLILYRFSGWSQDLIWIIICWMAIKKFPYWKGYNKYFFIYMIVITILEIIYAFSAILLKNNLFLDYIYITIEFILLGLFLMEIISIKWVRYLVFICSVLFVIFELFNAFWGQGYKNYNSYGAMINNVYLISLSVLAFSLLFRRTINKRLFSIVNTWFVLGIFLIYSSIILFDNLYSYSLALIPRNNNLLYAILIIQNFLKTLYLCCFIKGITLIHNKNSI